MEGTIKEISKSILLIILIILILVIYMLYENQPTYKKNKEIKGIGINSRTINMNILDDKIFCEDIIIFDRIPSKDMQYIFFKDKDYLDNVKYALNIKNKGYSTILDMRISEGFIELDEIVLSKLDFIDNNLSIKLTYELGIDYITRYKDVDVLSWDMDLESIDYLNNLTINLSSNIPFSNLDVDNATIKQTTDKYIITMNNSVEKNNIDILFNLETDLNKTITSKYIPQDTLKEMERYDYVNERIYILVILVILSILLFIITINKNKKTKTKNYRREATGLISPILAEAVVDGKIGLKELIMTTIIDLNIRGNINIINNDVLELVSLENLESYEKEIINLIFKKRIIQFNDINQIFSESNEKTLEFAQNINKIKTDILEKIYSMNIFSVGLTILNKIIRLCAILISINLPLILLSDSDIMMFEPIIYFLNGLTIFYYIKTNINRITMQEEIINNYNSKKRDINVMMIYACTIFIIITTAIAVAKYYPLFFVITILTLLLNMYTAYRCKEKVLTENGKNEQLKLMELKNYINDYSLIKNRDLESAVIWDEYLAYATAFGIPNNITNSVYEKWYNLNLNLQVAEKILR